MTWGGAAWGEMAWGEAGEILEAPPPSGIAQLIGLGMLFEQGEIVPTAGTGVAVLTGLGMVYEAGDLAVVSFSDDQWTQGTIDLTQNSRTVVGVGTEFRNLDVGHLLIVPRSELSMVVYQITAISDDSSLTISAPWPAASVEGVPYVVHRRLSPGLGVPLLAEGDQVLAQLMTYSFIKLDQLIG